MSFKIPDGEDLKRYGKRWWSKKSTGASRWEGGYLDRLYIMEKGRPIPIDKDEEKGHRRRHLPSSDHDKTWWSFDLNKCFRFDVFFQSTHGYYNRLSRKPVITLDQLKSKELESDELWNDEDFEKSYQQTTPHYYSYGVNIGMINIGSDFGWMYRSYLQNYFMIYGVEQYDIVKGLKPDWEVLADDPVWVNPKKPQKLENPRVPPPYVSDDADEPSPDMSSVRQLPTEVVVNDVALLFPLFDMSKADVENTLNNLKKCIENRTDMGKKKVAACEKYNSTLQQSLDSAIDKYVSRISYLEVLNNEYEETLKILCTKYAQGSLTTKPPKPEVQANIRRMNAKGNLLHIKEVSGRVPPLMNVQHRDEQLSLQRDLQNLIDQMKQLCKKKD